LQNGAFPYRCFPGLSAQHLPVITQGASAMQPISFHDFQPAAGCLAEWIVSPDTAELAVSATADPAPPSYNQELHLRSAAAATMAGLPGNPWIGAAFEIDGAADLDALELTFTTWLRRHEALRSGFRVTPDGGERFTLAADEISLRRTPPRSFASSTALHAYLDDRFITGTDPFAWPPLVLGVISRPDRSTVFLAMDHVCGDGYSLAMAVWELRTTYTAAVHGEEPVLPETGSYLEFCREERDHGELMEPDAPVVAHWREFVRACGGTTPTFPLDLGVQSGQTWPQSLFNRRLVSAEQAEEFDAVCREAGASFFAGLLAAMGLASREITGQEDFRTITPVHTRYKRRWRSAMGWFVTCAPLEISIGDATTFSEVLPRAQGTVRNALRHSRYPAGRVIELLGDDFRVTRRDLFSMVSYTDYRTMPGADSYPEYNPVTMGQVSVADDTHVWASRTHDGLHVAIRHPDTPIAADILDEYAATIGAVLGRVGATGDYPVAPAWACRPLPGRSVNAG
jgi:mycolipenoyl-CoA---2-(long-chain-fatty acyl)-trehalose mycolipenoyltransferase / long-chain-acyl-CoA---trehalose acyltransferase